jgi:hypothetical protein
LQSNATPQCPEEIINARNGFSRTFDDAERPAQFPEEISIADSAASLEVFDSEK